MAKKITVEIISALLVLLWAYAALSKLLDYETFKFQLGRSPYIAAMASSIAWIIPVTELIICLLLVIRRSRLIGLYASFFLMALFTGYIYAMLNYSYYVPCSCGGVLSEMSWEQHFIFNILATLIALTGVFLESPVGAGYKRFTIP